MKDLKSIPSEHEEQVAFLQWLKLQFPAMRYFSIPNGFFSKNMGMIKKLKREGMQSGIPDLFIPAIGVFVEMKRTKNYSISSEQKDWINYLEEHCQYKVIVAKGCQDAITQLMNHLNSID